MDQAQLLEDIQTRMGGASEAQAERAVVATLSGLAEVVRTVDLEPLAQALPRCYAQVLYQRHRDASETLRSGDRRVSSAAVGNPQCGPDRQVDLATFFARVASREGVPIGYAMEHAQAVCRALWGLIDEQARAQLSIALWPELLRPSLQDRLEARRPSRTESLWPAD